MSKTQFNKLKLQSDSEQIKNGFCGCEESILDAITCHGQLNNDGEELVDLSELCGLIDLFIYVPKKQEKIKGQSPDMFRILSSNKHDSATASKNLASPEENRLKRQLELIWLRINERYSSFQSAFRFFDLNFNNRVSFNEFSKGLEVLKVKINLNDQLDCFNYLDTDGKAFITYDNFCNLAHERRQQIDPAMEMIEEFRKKNKTTLAKGSADLDYSQDGSAPQGQSSKDLSDLDAYLNKISFEDLLLLKKNPKIKSTKNLDGGPFISGKLTVPGV